MALRDTVRALEADRKDALSRFELAAANLKKIEDALAQLRDEAAQTKPDRNGPYVGLDISDAAERFIREKGKAQDTGTIARVLKERGVQTTGESRWVQIVFSTLHGKKNTRFKRVKGAGGKKLWDLVTW